MKITHVVDKGLSEGETARLSALLCGLSDEFEVGLIAPENSELVEVLGGTRVKILPLEEQKKRGPETTNVYNIARMVRREAPSVLHLGDSPIAAAAARLCGVGVIFSESARGIFRSRYRAVLAPSPTEAYSAELIRRGVSPTRIKRLDCGVPPLSLSGEDERVLVISKCLVPDEYRLVIAALGRLSRGLRPTAEIFVPADEISAAVRYAELVCPTGLISVKDRRELSRRPLERPAVFVYPVLNDSRLPLLPMRFMSAGVPVLLSDTPTSRELLGGSGAFFFSVGDPFSLSERLGALISDESLRRAASERVRGAWTARFSPEKMIEDYASLYRALRRVGVSDD